MPPWTSAPSASSGSAEEAVESGMLNGTSWVARPFSIAATSAGVVGAAWATPWAAATPAPTASSRAPVARLGSFIVFAVRSGGFRFIRYASRSVRR